MKKISLSIFALFFTTAFLAAQVVDHPEGIIYGGGRDVVLTCPPNSIFGQYPYTSGSWSTPISDVYHPTTGIFSAYYENFSQVNGEICKIDFWGLPWQNIGATWYPCTENPMTFRIKFFDGAGYPGNLVYTFDTQIIGASTGVVLLEAGGQTGELLYYETDLPLPLNLSSGYVSIQGISVQTTADCAFGWMNSPVGDLFGIYETPEGTFYSNQYNLSLCLGANCNTASIPLSNWALFIGIGLIVFFTVLRFRSAR